jgi:Bacterial Ig-like domain (group 2)
MSNRLYLTVALAALATLPAQAALRITSPKNLTVVSPGETIFVDVAVSGEPLIGANIAAADPIKDSQVLSAPPYHFPITIPTKITPGLYALTAEGRSPHSELQTSQPISIDVERPDSPQSITTDLSRLELAVGDQSDIAVIGTYGDGSTVELTKSTQTKYTTARPGVVSVSSDGLVTGLAVGSTEIVINHKGNKAEVRVIVTRGPK